MEAKAISRNNCRAAAAGLFIPMCNCLRDTVRACVRACMLTERVNNKIVEHSRT